MFMARFTLEVVNMRYVVAQFSKDGKRSATMSGMGRNKGTWDHTHGRSAAYHYAAQCRKDDPKHVYKVETE